MIWRLRDRLRPHRPAHPSCDSWVKLAHLRGRRLDAARDVAEKFMEVGDEEERIAARMIWDELTGA